MIGTQSTLLIATSTAFEVVIKFYAPVLKKKRTLYFPLEKLKSNSTYFK